MTQNIALVIEDDDSGDTRWCILGHMDYLNEAIDYVDELAKDHYEKTGMPYEWLDA